MNGLDTLHAQSPIREYMDWMAHTGNEPLYKEKYAAIVEAQKAEKPCFITVVIRTQGKRIDMLQDVFLCLQAQVDQDFEVVVICHRAEKSAYEAVCQLIRQQGEAFAAKTRCIASDEGQRGAPINLGFAYARGAYAVCLDDDDLVFDHWIACFHDAAQTQQGKILHAYVLTQSWRVIVKGDRQHQAAMGPAGHDYCVPYQTIRQQSKNRCPFMGLAFPMFLFREMHILFDEAITTTEDWDYLLRTAGIAGVWDIPEPTAIYRLWNAQDTSRNLHQYQEWKDNYRLIGERMASVPLLVPSAEAAPYRVSLMGLQDDDVEKGRASFLNIALLFWSDGENFTDAQHMSAPVSYGKKGIRVCFDLDPQEDTAHIRRIRIDPARAGLFTLSEVKVTLRYDGGETVALTMADMIATNGVAQEGDVFFLTEDPMMVFSAEPQGNLRQIVMEAALSYRCPQMVHRWVAAFCADANWMAENTNRARLYLNHGAGYSDAQCLVREHIFRESAYHAVFDISPEQAAGLLELRFDPTEAGMLWLDELHMVLTYQDGHQTEVPVRASGWFNGFETEKGAAFIEHNPYLFLPVEAGAQLVRAEITARIAFVNTRQMERLFAQATRVPDYALLCAQLDKLRQTEE